MKRHVPTTALTLVLGVAVPLGSIVMMPREVDAGSAPAEISCTAKDTGEVLSGTIPRDSYDLELTLDDGKGHTHTWSDVEAMIFTEDIDAKVLMIYIDGEVQLKFWALPPQVKVERKRRERHGPFGAKAVISGFASDSAPRPLSLACTYDYAI